jgi:hypothetical protein
VQPGCTRRPHCRRISSRREVEKELTGRESERWEIAYFKLYKTQIPVIDQAIETAALMLGTDKSRALLPGDDLRRFSGRSELGRRRPNLTTAIDITVLQISPWRTTAGFSARSYRESFVKRIRPKRPRLRLDFEPYDQLKKQVLRRDGWRCQVCGSRRNLQVHHKELRSQQGADDELNLITLYADCHNALHQNLRSER